ncbi:MAG: hypothetical protein AB1921_17520 [Thermodesulfobacteriota bacterium]
MKAQKILAVLMLVTAVGLVAFWTMFFTVGLAPENAPSCYLTFEHSFPLPDILLAIVLFFAGKGLLAGRAKARDLALFCSGALMFLGVLDFSFNIQNGMYTLGLGEAVGNAFINIWCVGFGLAILLILPKPNS